MKVLILSQGLGFGGAERVISLLSNNLSDIGLEIHFVAVYSKERAYKLNDDIKYYNINTDKERSNKITRLLSRSYKIKKIHDRIKPDYIISFIDQEAILLFKSSAKKVFSLRNDPNKDGNGFVRKHIRNYIYSKADKIVFQTDEAKSYFNDKIQKKGIIIENPISSNLPLWTYNNNIKKIITVCRLEPQKNLKMLMDAFDKVYKKYPEYELNIYGKGSMYSDLVEYKNTLDSKNKIYFKGVTNKIYEIMKEASIFALSSDYEGISNSMLEALAIGVPTICTDCPVGGARRFITNEINGMLIAVNDSEAMYESMIKIIENPHLAQKLSNANNNLRNELSIENIMKKWQLIIQ